MKREQKKKRRLVGGSTDRFKIGNGCCAKAPFVRPRSRTPNSCCKMLMPMLRFIYCFAFEMGLFLILVWVVVLSFLLLLLSFMCLSRIEFHWNMMMAPAPYHNKQHPNGRAANFRECNKKKTIDLQRILNTHADPRTLQCEERTNFKLTNLFARVVRFAYAFVYKIRDWGERYKERSIQFKSSWVELIWICSHCCCCCCCFLLLCPSSIVLHMRLW